MNKSSVHTSRMPAVSQRVVNLRAAILMLERAEQEAWNTTQLDVFLEAAQKLLDTCKVPIKSE